MNRFEGRFIVLDGPDGCGKSTQVQLISEWIRQQGVPVVSYRDPGTTLIGEKIREILLNTEHVGMGDNVEVLLYMAARAQLWKERIAPDLTEGKCVLMDRWISSTCAYQGWAGNFGVENVLKIGSDALERVWPDVTIVLDVDLETAAGRMNRELDRMEQKGKDYHSRVREGFLKLVEQGLRIFVVNAARSIEVVQQDVREFIEKAIEK